MGLNCGRGAEGGRGRWWVGEWEGCAPVQRVGESLVQGGHKRRRRARSPGPLLPWLRHRPSGRQRGVQAPPRLPAPGLPAVLGMGMGGGRGRERAVQVRRALRRVGAHCGLEPVWELPREHRVPRGGLPALPPLPALLLLLLGAAPASAPEVALLLLLLLLRRHDHVRAGVPWREGRRRAHGGRRPGGRLRGGHHVRAAPRRGDAAVPKGQPLVPLLRPPERAPGLGAVTLPVVAPACQPHRTRLIQLRVGVQGSSCAGRGVGGVYVAVVVSGRMFRVRGAGCGVEGVCACVCVWGGCGVCA
jgi:hypothetical protein